MSHFIGTKTPSQCRSHHQKFFKRLQRNRMIANGQPVNEDDWKKNKKKNNMLKKKKKELKNENQDELNQMNINLANLVKKSLLINKRFL